MATAASTAAAAAAVEDWGVFIAHDDRSKQRAFTLPNTTSLAEVRAMYATDVDADPRTIVLLTQQGHRVADTQVLEDVGEVLPGAKMIRLRAEETVDFAIVIYGVSEEIRTIGARLTDRPADLREAICQLFGFPQDRHFRLTTPMALLQSDVALRDQDVDQGTPLVVDLGFKIEVKESWTGSAEQCSLFSTDRFDDLMFGLMSALMSDDDHDIARLRYLQLGGRPIDVGDDLLESLTGLDAVSCSHVTLHLHVQRSVTVLAGPRIKSCRVWPDHRVGQLLARCSAASVMLDGRLVSKSDNLSWLDMPEDSLLHTQPAAVHVRLSSGRRQVVTVPRLGAIADVRQAVRAQEESDDFDLVHGGRTLNDDEAIVAAAAADGVTLSVARRSIPLRVTLPDRSVRWTEPSRALRFTDLMSRVARHGRVRLQDLLGRTLECVGCGRRLTRADEAFQQVPADCCRVRSLKLQEPTPPQTRDAGTQSQTPARRRSPQHRSVSARPDPRDRKTQTKVVVHQAACQTEPAAGEAAAPASVRRVAASVATEELLLDLLPTIRVVLPGPRSFRLAVRPGATPRSVIDLLRRRRLLMGAREVRAGGAGSLSARPGWRERPLSESGVGPGSEVFVDAVVPQAVLVVVCVPEKAVGVGVETVAVPHLDSAWDAIQDAVRRLSGHPMDGSASVEQFGALYTREGHPRQSVVSWDEQRRRLRWSDEDDGSHRTHFLMDLITPGSGIAAAPGHIPLLQVFVRFAVCTIPDDGVLLPAAPDAVFDPRAILLLETLQLRLADGTRADLMVRLRGGEFADAATGAVHADQDTATASLRHVPGTWTRAWTVYRDGDRLLRCKLPEGKTVRVWTRRGVEVEAVEGRVTRRAAVPADVSGSRWMTSVTPSPLGDAVSRQMRR